MSIHHHKTYVTKSMHYKLPKDSQDGYYTISSTLSFNAEAQEMWLICRLHVASIAAKEDCIVLLSLAFHVIPWVHSHKFIAERSCKFVVTA